MVIATSHRPPLTQARHVQRLRDLAGRMTWVAVNCGRCERHGRLHLGRLLARHGPETGVPDEDVMVTIGETSILTCFAAHRAPEPPF
jgi:hypothetical protein